MCLGLGGKDIVLRTSLVALVTVSTKETILRDIVRVKTFFDTLPVRLKTLERISFFGNFAELSLQGIDLAFRDLQPTSQIQFVLLGDVSLSAGDRTSLCDILSRGKKG